MQGLTFNIQRFSIHDGPGIRTTVFFKGCNLKCAWCHNPESQSPKKELLFYADKCAHCGRCDGIGAEDENFVCYHGARELCGKEMTAEAVLAEVLKDMAFYENSGGGVTFSGGECMLQPEYLAKLLKMCKEKGIHTAVDTAGHISWEHFERILPDTDLFLYDIKLFDPEKHKQYVGAGNELILENLKKLLERKATVWIRIPIIPGINDSMEEMEKIKAFLLRYGAPEKVELLPYHPMGEGKYRAIGKEACAFETPTAESMQLLRSVFHS